MHVNAYGKTHRNTDGARSTNTFTRTAINALCATVFAWCASANTYAGPVSGCVLNTNTTNGRQHQTCSLFETDANGNFFEGPVTVTSLLGNNWDPLIGFLNDGVDQDTPGALSDIIVFTSNTATLYSDGTPEFDRLLATIVNVRQFRTETGPDESSSPFTNGAFTRGASTDPNDDDIFQVFSATPAEVPEPSALAVVMIGLAGLVGMRRAPA